MAIESDVELGLQCPLCGATYNSQSDGGLLFTLHIFMVHADADCVKSLNVLEECFFCRKRFPEEGLRSDHYAVCVRYLAALLAS